MTPSPTGQGQASPPSALKPTLKPIPTEKHSVQVINVADWSDSDQLGTETGYDGHDNAWLAYMRYTAKTLKRKDCIICGHARPVLATHPFAIGEGEGWLCNLSFFYQQQPNTTFQLCSFRLRSKVPFRSPRPKVVLPGAQQR
uniref:Uncharacterized protein n=1 Tax=Esox lucius TaxID=8010 RepID=A0A6Q2Y2H3_ESOLU